MFFYCRTPVLGRVNSIDDKRLQMSKMKVFTLFILNEKVVTCTVYNLYFIRIRNMKLFKPAITTR
jgi:hypothetical protein